SSTGVALHSRLPGTQEYVEPLSSILYGDTFLFCNTLKHSGFKNFTPSLEGARLALRLSDKKQIYVL
ncbi:MAG: hypothetical protein C0175_05255, partial [Caldisericum exile]